MLVNILCLNNPLGAWDEDSLSQGVGGSETNAIGLARLLGKNGHNVVVYNDVKKIKYFGNVSYVPKSIKYRVADLWIVWRDPTSLIDIKDKKGKKILWLHDLNPEQEILPYIHLVDKIWVQSLFHRGTYPNIEDDKIVVIPSGIIPLESKSKRDEHTLCYTSDLNRGLDILLEIWPNYLFKYPNDKLMIAYGTQTQEAIAKNADKVRGDDLTSRQWSYRWENLQLRMKLKGVKWLGKINKKELADLYETSSLMAYPSIFPETQCQVVLDALYHGCVPVTSMLGALQETNIGGFYIDPKYDMTSNHYLGLLLRAREQVTEGRRDACRDLAVAYTWDSLYSRIKSEILGQ